MSRIYILLFLLALGHDCQAAKQIDSPNGAWTLKRTPLKTLTGDPTEGIGVFPAAGGEPVAGMSLIWLPPVDRWSAGGQVGGEDVEGLDHGGTTGDRGCLSSMLRSLEQGETTDGGDGADGEEELRAESQ